LVKGELSSIDKLNSYFILFFYGFNGFKKCWLSGAVESQTLK